MTEKNENQATNCEKGFKNWLKRNKYKIIIGVTAAASVVGGIVFFKRKSAIEDIINSNGVKNNVSYKIVSHTGSHSREIVTDTLSDVGEQLLTNECTTDAVCEVVVERTSSLLNDGKPFPVKGFPRNLPEGHKASPEKIAEAKELGIELGPNQTYVDPCIKNAA